ncbi:unnamed protein product [Rhizopus stolonifer]
MATDIDTLVSMGFSLGKVKKAWKATNGAGLQPAMDWLLSHPEVSDEPEEEVPENISTNENTNKEEGEIAQSEQTASSLIVMIVKNYSEMQVEPKDMLRKVGTKTLLKALKLFNL